MLGRKTTIQIRVLSIDLKMFICYPHNYRTPKFGFMNIMPILTKLHLVTFSMAKLCHCCIISTTNENIYTLSVASALSQHIALANSFDSIMTQLLTVLM